MPRCLAALLFLSLVSPLVLAKDADAGDAKRWVGNVFDTADAKARDKEIARLAGWTLDEAGARDVRQHALGLQRKAPAKLPQLKEIHEGAYEYIYEVRSRGAKYTNFAMLDLPRGLAADTPVPLVLGLHSDLGTAWYELSGLRTCAREGAAALRDCIIACPQALNRGNTADDPRENPPGDKEYFGWGPKQQGIDTVFNLLDELLQKFNIDRNRIYLTGVGMGGQACFELVQLRPSQFAAICVRDATPGFHLPDAKEAQLAQLRTDRKLHEQKAELPFATCFGATPVYWVHADGDKKFPTEWARAARDAMKAAGVPVDYREYEGFHGGGPSKLIAAAVNDCLKVTRDPTPTLLIMRNVIGDKERDGNDRCYWLRVKSYKRLGSKTDWPAKRYAGGLVRARIERVSNTILLESEDVNEVEILLHDDMLYLDREVNLLINGKASTCKPPAREVEQVAQSTFDYRQSGEVYCAKLTIKLR